MTWKTAPGWAIILAEQGQSKYGTPAGLSLAIAQLESSFNIAAVNKTSGAMGLMQVLPRFEEDYRKMMAAVDPTLRNISLMSQDVMLGIAAVMRYWADRAKNYVSYTQSKPQQFDEWRWAAIAHRWGQNSEQIKTYRTQQRVLDIERLIDTNKTWYDGKQRQLTVVRTLRQGDTGQDVKDLQNAINRYFESARIPVTGLYDAKTVEYIKIIQGWNNLTTDGITGTKTRNVLGV